MLRLRDTIVIQILLVGTMWVFLWNFNPFKNSAQELIAQVDAQERNALFQEIELRSKTPALSQKGTSILEEKIDALSSSLKWEKKRFQVYPRIVTDGIVPVDIRMEFAGKPEQIPVFIEGLKLMPFLGVLSKLEIDSFQQVFVFQLRFYRTDPQVPSWIDKDTDLSTKDKALLRQGFLLMYWKSVQQFFVEEDQQNALKDPLFNLEVLRKLTKKESIYWDRERSFYK